ncbi:MAG: hypothetical protein KJ720_08765 [Proteobacteria bacterium]|nr:hypothetical protein [Pseudomonadota bacterium]MBU1451361.1 hypothetical protein [Pseudomonadota bacterium]MBU2469518.1 hypothetical protein [Pseudomonadota bacterium]MBU2517341.1 hypothetical protein [Pseudomonadota bacterium]
MALLGIPKPDLDPVQLALAINHDRPNEQLEQSVRDCLVQARELIAPRAVYELLAVVGQGPDWIEVQGKAGGSTRLTVGPKTDLLGPAERVLVGATTIGHELDDAVKRLNQQGDPYAAYVLDCVGVSLLGEAGKALDRLAEEVAARRGWGVGHRLAPGSLPGWDMTDQKVLAGLVLAGQGAIIFNDVGVLWPFKSATSLIGMGQGFISRRVGRVCHMCSKRETCWSKEK